MVELATQARPDTSYDENAPVKLTQKEVEASEERKAKKPKTIRQLPVFRAASNVSYMVAQIESKCPRKMRCFVDELEHLTTELLRVLVAANECRQQRWEFCADAYSVTIIILVKMEVLLKLGIMGKDDYHKVKRLLDSLTAQIKGWQNSVNKQGIQL